MVHKFRLELGPNGYVLFGVSLPALRGCLEMDDILLKSVVVLLLGLASLFRFLELHPVLQGRGLLQGCMVDNECWRRAFGMRAPVRCK